MTSAAPVEQQRDAVRRLERAGYCTAWTNEAIGGKDALVQIAVLLAATERMVFGTGIANIWARVTAVRSGSPSQQDDRSLEGMDRRARFPLLGTAPVCSPAGPPPATSP
jgi:hypothetical protein